MAFSETNGSCLVEIATGTVLGLHRAGDATLGNRSIPVWDLNAALDLPSGIS